MGNTSGAKHNRFLYNLNKNRKKSGDKYKKAIEWYVDLLKKESKQGETLWIKKTKQDSLARIKRYGITKTMIVNVLERKGLKNLESLITL